MNYEAILLSSAIKNREAYNEIAKSGSHEEFSDLGKLVWKHASAYYLRDSAASSIVPSLLTESLTRTALNDKHKSLYQTTIDDLTAIEVSAANVCANLRGARSDVVRTKLASLLMRPEDRDGAEEITKLIDEYNALIIKGDSDNGESTAEIIRGLEVPRLVSESYGGANLIPLVPRNLNSRIGGGALRGHHILVFARPEVGKTLVAIDMAASFAKAGLTVLYAGNEDPIHDLVLRLVSRMTGMTKYEILEAPEEADVRVRSEGYEHVIMASLTPGTAKEIETLVTTYKPDVLILDQLRNLDAKEQNYTIRLELAAKTARAMAKRHKLLAISLTQAGDSASNKSVLDMGDVDFSNTGIPAQVDLMIGVGANTEDMNSNRRVYSLCKNKLSGDHSHFPVRVDPALSKVIDV